MTKYRVGDVVRVRSDLVVDKKYGGEYYTDAFVDDMAEFCGKDVTICDADSRGRYEIEEEVGFYSWTADMFAGIVKPRYRVGDLVRVRNDLIVGETYGIDMEGARCLFVPGMEKHCGKMVRIAKVDLTNMRYRIVDDNRMWNWTDDMFEDVVGENEENEDAKDKDKEKEHVGWSGVEKLRVGDLVRFRTDMRVKETYGGTCWIDGMQEYAGKMCTVSRVSVSGYVNVAEDPDSTKWFFSPEMFAEVWRDGKKIVPETADESAQIANSKEVDCSLAENSLFVGKLVCTESSDDDVISAGHVVVVENGEFIWKNIRFHHVFGVSSVVWGLHKQFGVYVEFVQIREAR